MSKKPFSLWTDQDICNWFDGLDEDYIRSLIDLHGDYDITPRKAFHYVFGDLDSQLCTCQACKLSLSLAPVQTPPSGSVAAPIEAAQGQGTPSLDKPVCRRGACAPDRLCASCEFPLDLGAVGASSLPAEVPESETLWAYLSRGYGLDYVRSGLVCGIPHVEQEARLIRDRVQRAWARIVSGVQ